MTDETQQARPEPAPARPQPGIDVTQAPDWWLTRPAEIREFLESLEGVAVEEIGRSAGGRPIIAAAWGASETLPGRTSHSLSSAMAGGDPTAFFGAGKRARPELLFVGAAHGTELDGTVAMLNLLNVVVTGSDLRGRPQPALAEAARKQRLAIIPILNVDGRQRAADHVNWIGCDVDYYSMICQGRRRDGEILRWPTSKRTYPMPAEEMEVLGTYYNDAGVNLVYDTGVAGACQPESEAMLRYCNRHLPDAVLLSHSDSGTGVQPPSAFMPRTYRQRADQFAAAVATRCAREGFHKADIPHGGDYGGGKVFYQSDAVYHGSGALPLVVEFPCGYRNVPDNHDAILDFCLAVLEEILTFANRYGYRPSL